MAFIKHSEYNEQVNLFKWANLAAGHYPPLKWLNSSQNGVKLTSIQAGARAKRSGMKKGFPDVFLPWPNSTKHGLFIEMKSEKGRATPEQKEWIIYLNKVGYKATICHGWLEAREIIIEYLEG